MGSKPASEPANPCAPEHEHKEDQLLTELLDDDIKNLLVSAGNLLIKKLGGDTPAAPAPSASGGVAASTTVV